MNKKFNINEGGEGTWNIPRGEQTNVLAKVQVPFEEGESPVEYDSSENEMDGEMEERAGKFVGEMEYENRLELSRADAREIGRKINEVLEVEF